MKQKLTPQEKGERKARKKLRNLNSGGYILPPMPLTRKMARAVAHTNMRKHGAIKVNKTGFFANNWREWVHKTPRNHAL